ncbi:MAG: hypothetical protein ACREPV_11540 [Lysobacter sp.]
MKIKLVLAAIFLIPSLALASPCEAPEFEPFVQHEDSGGENPYWAAVEVNMQPVATLSVPTGFSKMGGLPYGSIIFGGHPGGISAVLTFETRQTLAVHRQDVTPATFMLSLFKGLDEVGCRYMEGQNLADEDYRLYARLDENAELFAYGSSDTHQFYVIRQDRPEEVLSGLFKNITRAQFERILSTIKTK